MQFRLYIPYILLPPPKAFHVELSWLSLYNGGKQQIPMFDLFLVNDDVK